MSEPEAVHAKKHLPDRIRAALRLNDLPPVIRRLVIALIGFTVLLIGLAMVVLPGPAVVFIPLGIAILATEFVWAKRWMTRFYRWFATARNTVRRRAKAQPGRP